MMNDKKSPVQKFLEGKGFYIALALCVAGTGTAAWLAVNRTIDDIDDQNQKILESRPQTEDFTDPRRGGRRTERCDHLLRGGGFLLRCLVLAGACRTAQRRFRLIGAAEHIGSAVLAARSR